MTACCVCHLPDEQAVLKGQTMVRCVSGIGCGETTAKSDFELWRVADVTCLAVKSTNNNAVMVLIAWIDNSVASAAGRVMTVRIAKFGVAVR